MTLMIMGVYSSADGYTDWDISKQEGVEGVEKVGNVCYRTLSSAATS